YLVRSLQQMDCTIRDFKGSQSALEYLHNHAGDVDLLIADLRLLGLRGDELAREFQRMNPRAPVLLITGSDIEGLEFPVIGKPFSVETFQEKVRQLLNISSCS